MGCNGWETASESITPKTVKQFTLKGQNKEAENAV